MRHSHSHSHLHSMSRPVCAVCPSFDVHRALFSTYGVFVFCLSFRGPADLNFVDLREKFPYGRAHLKIEFQPHLDR